MRLGGVEKKNRYIDESSFDTPFTVLQVKSSSMCGAAVPGDRERTWHPHFQADPFSSCKATALAPELGTKDKRKASGVKDICPWAKLVELIALGNDFLKESPSFSRSFLCQDGEA